MKRTILKILFVLVRPLRITSICCLKIACVERNIRFKKYFQWNSSLSILKIVIYDWDMFFARYSNNVIFPWYGSVFDLPFILRFICWVSVLVKEVNIYYFLCITKSGYKRFMFDLYSGSILQLRICFDFNYSLNWFEWFFITFKMPFWSH